jgi:hypothetical protein
MKRASHWGLAGSVLLGCGAEPSPTSVLGDEVGRVGWVDSAHTLVGDAATSFDSSRSQASQSYPSVEPWRPFLVEPMALPGP